MIYKISHKTTHRYKSTVSVGNHIACLTPRSSARHRCISHELIVTPEPATRSHRIDYFGNSLTLFTVQEPHKALVVEARSQVEVDHMDSWSNETPAWEEVVQSISQDHSRAGLDAYQFSFESPRIRPSPVFAAWAARSFTARRPLGEALLDLTARIHQDFQYDSKATNVGTPPEEVFRKRRGVCQDFAHVQIACLRSLRLPARYVSGYLRTYPPPGRPRLVGADASHAWVSVYCPGNGWLDADPTNNIVPSDSHVTLAWGRDYGDVSPLRGLILGGREHTLKVAVDMLPIE